MKMLNIEPNQNMIEIRQQVEKQLNINIDSLDGLLLLQMKQ
jgi:sensor domain CHASE-containing protein